MRILKVEFRNLNSLAGHWLVDFEHEDYLANGLFLITGPTGSGKTTLLDAICLALYGRTPRITLSKTHNEIMTRHTAECWAETSFATHNGRFRARWSQKRAFGRKSGKLQDAKRELVNLDTGKLIEDMPNLVNSRVEELTGLDFSQFTRAIMLAQSKFSAFLESGDDDKAIILEKLTDTGIYTELSRLAHEKAAMENKKLLELEQKAGELSILSSEEEEKKRSILAAIKTEVSRLDQEILATHQACEWLDRLERLQSAAILLNEQKKSLEIELGEFEPEAAILAGARKAAPFASMHSLIRSLAEQKQQIENKLDTLNSRSVVYEKSGKELGATLLVLEKSLADAKKALEQARPQIEQARELDIRLDGKNGELSIHRASLKNLQKKFLEQKAQIASCQEQATVLETRKDKAEKWLGDHANDAWLVENCQAMREKFASLQTLEKNYANCTRQIEKTSGYIQEHERRISIGRDKISKLQKQLVELGELATKNATALANVLDGSSLADMRMLLDALREQQRLASLVMSLDEMRRKLRPGQPCPLCGSTEHPITTGGLPVMDELDQKCDALSGRILQADNLERDRLLLENNRKLVTQQIAAGSELLADLTGTLANLKNELSSQTVQREQLRQNLNQKKNAILNELAILGIPADMPLANLNALLGERLQAWQNTLAARDDLAQKIEARKSLLAALETGQAHIARELSEKELAEKTLAAECARLARQRAGLFGGKNIMDVEAVLAGEISKAEAALFNCRNEFAQVEKNIVECNGAVGACRDQAIALDEKIMRASMDFRLALEKSGLDEETFLGMQKPQETIDRLTQREKLLAERKTGLLTRLRDNAEEFARENELALTDKKLPELEMKLQELRISQDEIRKRELLAEQELLENEKMRVNAMSLAASLERQKRETRKWQRLDACMGSADGKVFRGFAQSVTLDFLLAHANVRLAKITDRYILRRSPDSKSNLEIEVIDNYQAGEIRSIKNLSGGEIFMLSLALSLGLSSMAGKNAVLGSLFLDEGFGTLDSETLETAWQAIASLRHEGKLIGIISHVEGLLDKIPTKIQVKPLQMGRSELSGPGCSRVWDA